MSTLPAAHVVSAALLRAGLCDERETAERARDEGRRLVLLLVGLVRNSRLGSEPALSASAGEVVSLVGRLIDALGTLRLAVVEGGLELNALALRFGDDEPQAAQLVQEFERHQLTALTLHGALDAASARTLARALAEPARPGQALPGLADGLSSLPSVELTGHTPDEPARSDRADAWESAGAAVREAYAALAAERQPDLVTLRHVADDLGTAARRAPERALATPIWALSLSHGERHVLAVTSLSVCLGQHLGLDPRALSDLGLSALLHAAGAAGATHDDLGRGLRRLAVPRGFRDGKLRRLLTLCGGHPATGEDTIRHLYARVLRIVGDYDRLTAPRPDQPRLAPPMAQAALWAARGSVYDADLLALFVQMMGLYPPGSLCELSDGRAVVTTSGGRSAERFAWPCAQVVRDNDRAPGARLDLFDTRDSLRPRRVLNPGSVPFDQKTLFPH